jgi:hypothetical protein
MMEPDKRLFIENVEKFLIEPLPPTDEECNLTSPLFILVNFMSKVQGQNPPPIGGKCNHYHDYIIEGRFLLDFIERIQTKGWLYLEKERLEKVKSQIQDRLDELVEKELRSVKPQKDFIRRNRYLKGKSIKMW